MKRKNIEILIILFCGFIAAKEINAMQEFRRTDWTIKSAANTHLKTETDLEDYIATSIIKANAPFVVGDIFKEFRLSDNNQNSQKITTIIETFSVQTREVISKKWNEDTLTMTLSVKFDPNDVKKNLENYRNNIHFRMKADSIIKIYTILRDSLQNSADSAQQINLIRKIAHQNAEIYIIKGDLETNDFVAIEYYNRALRISPHSGNIHIRIADRYKNLNENNQALRFYRRGIQLQGDTTYAMFGQAQILQKMSLENRININMAVDAANMFRDVFARDSSYIEAMKNRGILQYYLAENIKGDISASRRLASAAIISLKTYAEKHAGDEKTRRYLHKSYMLLGDEKNAALWSGN